ncbi:MAG: BMC domain-containing protein, partial [Bacillota bacterium]
MAGTALGLIETKGLVAAIEALDASLKAAQVRLAGMDLVSGGLVAIRVTGDTGAVRAAVSAGECAARRVGTLVASHVIPRPHAEIGGLAYGPGVRGRPGGPCAPG